MFFMMRRKELCCNKSDHYIIILLHSFFFFLFFFSVLSRVESEGNLTKSLAGLSLLHLTNTNPNATVPTQVLLSGFQLGPPHNSTASNVNCSLVTPLLCEPATAGFSEMFLNQPVGELELDQCTLHYENLSTPNAFSCISQKMCIQPGLGAVLVCSNGLLGFSHKGASCSQGQIGWPAIVSKMTNDLHIWVRLITGHREETLSSESVCGIAQNDNFPWFVFFNITRSQTNFCLGALVANDSFPLITSQRCLRKCLRAKNEPGNSCDLEKTESSVNTIVEVGTPTWSTRELPSNFTSTLCAAKNVSHRLSHHIKPYNSCFVAYMSNIPERAIKFEEVNIMPFSFCSEELFFDPNLQNESLCLSSVDDIRPLNCENWADAGLVQCARSEDGRWELLGLAPACPNRPTARWLLRILNL